MSFPVFCFSDAIRWRLRNCFVGLVAAFFLFGCSSDLSELSSELNDQTVQDPFADPGETTPESNQPATDDTETFILQGEELLPAPDNNADIPENPIVVETPEPDIFDFHPEDYQQQVGEADVRAFELDKDRQDGALRIALILPSTQFPGFVDVMYKAATLALFNPADKQAQKNLSTTLLFFDSGTTKQTAAQAAQLAIDAKADIVVGPLLFDHVDAVSRITAPAGVPIMVLSNRFQNSRRGVYAFNPTPKYELDQLIRHIGSRESGNIAMLAENNEIGIALARAGINHESKRVKLSYIRFYDGNVTNLTSTVKQFSLYYLRRESLRREITQVLTGRKTLSDEEITALSERDSIGAPPFQGIILPIDSQLNLQTITGLLNLYDIAQPTSRFYGNARWGDFRNLHRDRSLIGARFVCFSLERIRETQKEYADVYGRVPPTLALKVHAAVEIAKSGADRAGNLSLDRLESARGYDTALGKARLNADGTSEFPMSLYRVASSGIVLERKNTRF